MSDRIMKRTKYLIAGVIDFSLKSLLRYQQFRLLKGHLPKLNNCTFLLVILDQLGDAIMATTVPEVIKKAYPKSRVDILIRPVNHDVFKYNPYVDCIIFERAPWWTDNPIWGSFNPKYLVGLFRNIERVRGNKYDVIIDLRGDLRHLILFGLLVDPKILIGYAKTGGQALLSSNSRYNSGDHEIRKKLRLLEALGFKIDYKQAIPKIWLKREEKEQAMRRINQVRGSTVGPIIIMDPGAKPVQQWPVQNFVEISRIFYHETGHPIILSSAPNYNHLVDEIELSGRGNVCKLGRVSIRELAAVIGSSNLIVSSDTGIAHIASSVGTPGVTLFGPTDPDRFWNGVNPMGIVKSPIKCCQNQLHEACLKPGHLHPGACMKATTVEAVAKAMRTLLMTCSMT